MTLLFNQQSAILSPFSIPTSALVMMAAAFTAALDSYREERGAFSGEYIFDHNEEAFLKNRIFSRAEKALAKVRNLLCINAPSSLTEFGQ